DGNVSCIDATMGVHIFSEVGGPNCLVPPNHKCERAFCLMIFTSPVVIAPLALTSLRKLALVTGCRACALQRLVSPLVTTPLALISPMSTPMLAEAALLKFRAESLTFAKLTVTY